jgi:hypothetical protein
MRIRCVIQVERHDPVCASFPGMGAIKWRGVRALTQAPPGMTFEAIEEIKALAKIDR